jgi:predicted site-specific integrase-resolvase
MPVTINGQTYYRTAEVCLKVGIGKSTLFRWIKEGVMEEAEHRDRRGWRLFTENEVNRVKMEVNGIRRSR